MIYFKENVLKSLLSAVKLRKSTEENKKPNYGYFRVFINKLMDILYVKNISQSTLDMYANNFDDFIEDNLSNNDLTSSIHSLYIDESEQENVNDEREWKGE